MKRPDNPARWSGPWHICNSEGQSIESHYSQGKAVGLCDWVNDHERRNGREPNYTVVYEDQVTAYYPT